MKVAADRLGAQLARGLSSIYLVSGDEPLLVGEASDAIRAAARGAGFGARERHVAERGFDWQRLAADARNLSLFAERKIVEIRIPTGKPGTDGAKALTAFAESASTDTLVLVIVPRLDRRAQSAKWVKAIEQQGVVVAVRAVGAADLPRWIEARMRRHSLQPSRGAVRLLADRVEGNLLAADQEIEKLALLAGGGRVDEAAVLQSVADSARFDVFQLVDAAMVGDATRALRIVDGLRSEGVEPPLVVWALGRELRTLLALAWRRAAGERLGDAIAAAGVWSSRRALVHRALERHPALGTWRAMLADAVRADRVAKGAPGDPWSEIAGLVAGLAGVAVPRPLAAAV